MIFSHGILESIHFSLPFLHILYLLIPLLLSYLLGSINSAVFISKLFYREDIRKHGSGNAGLTNMLRVFGKKAALFTLLGDVLKTILAVTVTAVLTFGFRYVNGFAINPYLYMSGLLCVVGHIFPIFYRFKGGKGVLCTAAFVALTTPYVFLGLIALFIFIVCVTKYVSLGSIVAGLLYPLVLIGGFRLVGFPALDFQITFSSIILGLLILWCHRANINRLRRGEESRFSLKSKKDKKKGDNDNTDNTDNTDKTNNTSGNIER